jgi:hypothetical protein
VHKNIAAPATSLFSLSVSRQNNGRNYSEDKQRQTISKKKKITSKLKLTLAYLLKMF